MLFIAKDFECAVGSNQAVDQHTVFEVASPGVTALATMDMVDRGVIELQTPFMGFLEKEFLQSTFLSTETAAQFKQAHVGKPTIDGQAESIRFALGAWTCCADK